MMGGGFDKRGYDSGGGYYSYNGKPPEYGRKNRISEFLSRFGRKELLITSFVLGFGIIFYVVGGQIYALVLTSSRELYTAYKESELVSLLSEMVYSLLCVCMPFLIIYAFLSHRGLTDNPIPFRRPYSGTDAFFLVTAGVGICMAGNILNSAICSYAQASGIGFHSYDAAVEAVYNSPTGAGLTVLTIIHTAVLPAFAEELAFRGCLMQPLRKFGDGFAVFCSALVFGLLHGNMTQAPFAMIAGAVLGLICVYTGSMWPNIILHLLNNLISVLQSSAVSVTQGKTSYLISGIIIYGLIIIGIVGLCGFFAKNGRLPSLNRMTNDSPFNKAVLFIAAPTVLIPLLYLLYNISGDIYYL